MTGCVITPGCGFGPHDPQAHPCGQPIRVGDPCSVCGVPNIADAEGAPVPGCSCWRPATIADLKAFAAEEGLQATLSLGKAAS